MVKSNNHMHKMWPFLSIVVIVAIVAVVFLVVNSGGSTLVMDEEGNVVGEAFKFNLKNTKSPSRTVSNVQRIPGVGNLALDFDSSALSREEFCGNLELVENGNLISLYGGAGNNLVSYEFDTKGCYNNGRTGPIGSHLVCTDNGIVAATYECPEGCLSGVCRYAGMEDQVTSSLQRCLNNVVAYGDNLHSSNDAGRFYASQQQQFYSMGYTDFGVTSRGGVGDGDPDYSNCREAWSIYNAVNGVSERTYSASAERRAGEAVRNQGCSANDCPRVVVPALI